MNASELLAQLDRRGATARAEIGDDGAAVLVVAPRDLIGDLLPDLARFKPALLELLSAPDFRQLAVEVAAAQRGQWITPTVPLLALWRAVNAHFGTNLTSQQIGALSRLVDTNATANADELHQLCADLIRQGENA